MHAFNVEARKLDLRAAVRLASMNRPGAAKAAEKIPALKERLAKEKRFQEEHEAECMQGVPS